MSRYTVKEHRIEVTRGAETRSMFFGWDVIEDGERVLNNSPLEQREAREMAATLAWMVQLDTWMIQVVEDEDVIEEVGDLLGILPAELDANVLDDVDFTRAYDRMIAGALEFLPKGMRLLADKYEAEWRNKHGRIDSGDDPVVLSSNERGSNEDG